MSPFMVKMVGLFNGTVRELDEMIYEFEESFVVDSGKFQRAFGDHATPLSEAIPATVEWFRNPPEVVDGHRLTVQRAINTYLCEIG